MIDFLSQVDSQIFLAVNSFHTPAIDQFMRLLSHRLVWVPLYVVTVFFIIHRFGWKVGLCIVAGAAVAVALSDHVCAAWIRPYIGRLRPSNPDNPISAMVHLVDGYRSGSYGFPSCHAANTFAFATFISLVSRRRLAITALVAWALFNCWSRMYLGVHYPGDLLVGAIIGSTIAVAVFFAMSRIIEAAMHRHTEYSMYNSMHVASNSRFGELNLDNSVALGGVVAVTALVLLCTSLFNFVMA